MPDRAPTGRPAPWRLDPVACTADLDAFARLLAATPDLAEKADILPFFRAHPHLAAFLGTYAYTANTVDQLAVEVGLFGQFVVDIVAGNQAKKAYCLIECEDGFADSIFRNRRRHTSTWAPLCRLRAASGLSGRATCRGCIANLHHLSVVAPHADGPANGPPIRSFCASPMGDEIVAPRPFTIP